MRSIIKKACQNSMPASGFTIGKKTGTIMAVAILLSRVNDVRFWMLPPSLPAMIAAADAVGIRMHSIKPWDMIAISLLDSVLVNLRP